MTMQLQRRHFELIAETIADAKGVDFDFQAHERFALRMARKLTSTNSNFNRDRFLRACGVEG